MINYTKILAEYIWVCIIQLITIEFYSYISLIIKSKKILIVIFVIKKMNVGKKEGWTKKKRV